MAKQNKAQQYIFKINSTLLFKNQFDLTLPLERARRVPGLVVSLADSQILTWINELNGNDNIDEKAREIKHEIKMLKHLPSSAETKRKIKSLYAELYHIQFREDYVAVIMDKLTHYDMCNRGFKINGISYKRLLCTTNGVKTSTVIYVSERLLPELKKRLDNGRNPLIPLVPAKLSAYEALAASASVEVSWPHGVCVVADCILNITADLINIDDSDVSKEPIVTPISNATLEQNCSDGCGMMLPSLAQRWSDELHIDGILSGCNLRNAFTKGMVFTFDFVEFAREVAGTYIIKDVWGNEHDVRDVELILTSNQLKLWMCYDSWDTYFAQCCTNHYAFRVAKTAPLMHEMDDVRQLNYQFIQPLDLSDADIAELAKPTVDEINDILGYDYRKTLVYLCGKGLDAQTIQHVEPICRALMIEPQLINDPYLYNRVRKMINKRIKDAKIGVLDVCGNFQILSGDLYALCEHMFEMPVHGLLHAGEIYSRYWMRFNASKVFCARAPMSNAHSLVSQNISYDERAAKWFKYMDSVIIVNVWDTMPQALNGFDFDGDLLFTTDNPVLLRNQHNLPALNCIQYNAKKDLITEELLIKI